MRDVLLRMAEEIRALRDRVRELEQTERLSWRDLLGAYLAQHLALPGLRGFWPMSSFVDGSTVYDLSGQGRNLSWGGNSSFGLLSTFAPYRSFDGVDDNLTRADEAGLSITGPLCLGGWFSLNTAAANMGLIGKWESGQRSYSITVQTGAPNRWAFNVSNNGTTIQQIFSSEAVTTGDWHHIVGRYTPSSELSIFVDGVKSVTTTSIFASILDSTAAFVIGGNGLLGFMNGSAAMCFVCRAGAGAMPDNLIQKLYYSGKPIFQQ